MSTPTQPLFTPLDKDSTPGSAPKTKSIPTRRQPSAKTISSPAVMSDAQLRDGLENIYNMIAATLAMTGDEQCATVITDNATKAAESLVELASKKPGLRKALVKLIVGGGYGMMIQAHLPILAVILAHHFPQVLAQIAGLFVRTPKPEKGLEEPDAKVA